MTPKELEEITDKLITDAMKHGEGFAYVDPSKFWKQPPWYKRIWYWIISRGSR